jgi:hypothetical protein
MNTWAAVFRCVFFATAGVAMAEGLAWLQTAAWPQWFRAIAIRYGPEEFAAWLAWPRAWFGLHKIVTACLSAPLFVPVLGVGAIVGVFVAAVVDDIRERLSRPAGIRR